MAFRNVADTLGADRLPETVQNGCEIGASYLLCLHMHFKLLITDRNSTQGRARASSAPTRTASSRGLNGLTM
ncbi:hypothetical protein Pve01_43040 [Planomonospora venezuelensis]|nr:hypothetical protein Pve01_43040 [Planomonospora venezuelensis]